MEFERTTRRKPSSLNLTPLIDVMFILIIFFMLTTTFMRIESLELMLPSASVKSAAKEEVMHLFIAANGDMTLGQRTLDQQELTDSLSRMFEKDAGTKIMLLTADGVTMQQLVNVMDRVYLAGGAEFVRAQMGAEKMTVKFERTRRKKIEISLIPLIDVSMFLLIFFMVAGTVEKFEILPIDPPVAQSGKMMDEGHITILLGSHDEIIVGEDIVPMEDMQKMLAPELAANPNKVVTVKADATVPANRVIAVMDAIKAAGGKNLSIVTQSKADIHVE